MKIAIAGKSLKSNNYIEGVIKSSKEYRLAKESLNLLEKFNGELVRILRLNKQLNKHGSHLLLTKEKGDLIIKRNVELRV